NCPKLDAKALKSVITAPMNIAAPMIGLRPKRSLTTLDTSSDTASAPVEIDSARLACAGVKQNSCPNSGSSGCTQYNKAKVEKPPKKSARLVRLNSGEPAEIAGVFMAIILGLLINTVQYIFEA